jgi:hypothetical protein
MRKSIYILFIPVLLGVFFYLLFDTYLLSKSYETSSREIALGHNTEQLVDIRLRDLVEIFSLGTYKNEKRDEINALKQKNFEQKKSIENRLFIIASLLFVILSSYFFLSKRNYTFFVASSALTALVFGVISPILMVVIKKDVEYLGEIVLSFESKGVLSSIMKLFEKQEYVVGAVILLFSVLLPFIKSLGLMFLSMRGNMLWASNIVKFFRFIGKWSMVDIFVVATFLVYLAGGSSDVSRVSSGAGLYIFLCYVFLSAAASFSAEKMLEIK